MSRSLFIGDSHCCGYYEQDGKVSQWHDNNYAEIYAKYHNKQTIIYAMPGACNRKYPAWIRSVLDRYDDIDEIFVQSGYWHRHLVAASKSDIPGQDIGIDHFLDDNCIKDNLVHRYTDVMYNGNYLEVVEQVRPENLSAFKPFKFDAHSITHEWSILHEPYHYTKVWHELMTQLQYRDYCLDLLAIDTMCKERNIKWYLWTINSRCPVPENIDLYTKLSPIRASKSAIHYLESKFIKTESYKLDIEHYDYFIHEKIATDYFTELKNNT